MTDSVAKELARLHGATGANWRPLQFLAHVALGLAALFLVAAMKGLIGPGTQQCCVLLLFPVSGWFISWWLPRGAPGASIAVAVCLYARFPSDAGPTAQALTTAVSAFLAGGMMVCEVVAAVVRVGTSSKRDHEARPAEAQAMNDCMRGVEVHDRDRRGMLAFDLVDVLAVLGAAALARVWTVPFVECSGAAAEDLHRLADTSASIDGASLQRIAGEITQVIDGEFLGQLPDEEAPSVVVRAVDSTMWEVFGPRDVLDTIAAAFTDVRPSRGHA